VSRTQKWIFALVALSAALSWYFARQGPLGPAARSDCLSHSDCQSTERCAVVPKGDGFATMGRCGELCTSDDGCPNGWTCRAWVEEKGYLLPEQGRPAEQPRVRVCAHHLEK
jgi:hypothetical protein